VLRRYCTVCHSQRNLAEVDISGGLALDNYDAVVKNKKPLLLPGKSKDSLMMQLVLTDNPEKRMPLGVNPLPPEAITVLRTWIDSGAKEGTKPADDSGTTIVTTPSARTRKLDVTLTTTAVPPPMALGPGAPAVLKVSMKVGPLSPVAAVVFSPDGKLLATGTHGRVAIWDLQTVKPVKVLTNVLGAVNDLRFSPDGKLLAVGGGQPSAKGDLRLYRVSDWKLLGTLSGHTDVVSGIAFSPDGKLLVSASFDKTVRIWDVNTRQTLQTFTGHSDFVYAAAFIGPKGDIVASVSKDRSMKLFETATGKPKLTSSDRDQDAIALAVHPDGKTAVVSGLEPGLSWWNTQTGERLRTQAGHGVAVYELCFSRDGSVVASAGGDGTVRLWNGSSGAPLRTATVGSLCYAVALSPDAKVVATGSFDGLVRLFETTTGRPLLTLVSLAPEKDATDWLALTPEGYAASSPNLATWATWRMGTAEVKSDAVWKALTKPDMLAKAARGETVPAVFGK
jgi:WD40 repeat protein